MAATDKLTVNDLPDYAALVQLASALWANAQSKGAAVLVGAGFSRNAELAGDDTSPPPTWSNLRDAMARELYQDRWQEAPKDPLRLADEFRIYLGQAALTDFLRRQIADSSWKPSELHRTLMALPWSDILTTNYDTLLERASNKHRAVRDENDLSQIRGARVIKLHGSVDANTHLILSEDDFRTYPVKHAAFVNTARQIFLENELCLLGFSGDDPNFLQWSGWVRDHLGDKARRIYLVGSLKLSAAKRRLMESRGVSPIDFAPLVADLDKSDQDKRCCELFLSFLLEKKPVSASDWRPAGQESYSWTHSDPIKFQKDLTDPEFARRVFDDLLQPWLSDFNNCPRWLIIPKVVREAINSGTRHAPFGYERHLELLDDYTRAQFLNLLLWRQSVTLQAFQPALAEALSEVLEEAEVYSAQQRVLHLVKLLSEARYRRDKTAFTRIESLLAKIVPAGSDGHAALVAERLMWARDGLDYVTLEKEIDSLSGASPIWTLLKAALSFDLGKADAAEALLQQSREDLADRARRDRNSTFAASRFAWANTLGRAVKFSKASTLRSVEEDQELTNGYDAQEEIDLISLQIRSNRLRRAEELSGFQPAFGAGHFKDHSRKIRFVDGYVGKEAELVFRFADAACLPLRLSYVDILSSAACYALDSEPLYTLAWYLRLVRSISAVSSPFLEKYFSDISLAKMGPELASELFDRILSAAEFWWRKIDPINPHSSIAIMERPRVLLEILSRLVIRSDTAKATAAFQFGLRLSDIRSAVHPWLYEPVGHLLDRSVLALPPRDRSNLALDCCEFPLPPDMANSPFRWPDPASGLFSRRIKPHRVDGDSRWRAAVANLLAAARSTGAVRSEAVHRLAYLSVFDCLETDERSTFGNALWLHQDTKEHGIPSDVDLYPHVTAALPAPNTIDPAKIAYSALFETELERDTADSHLQKIVAAARGGAPIPKFLPRRKQAVRLLDGLPSVMPQDDRAGDPFRRQAAEDRIHYIGNVIGWAILPQILPDDLDDERLLFILKLGRLGSGGGALAGWHELGRLNPPMLPKVIADLRRAIRRGDLYDTAGAALAVGTWACKIKHGCHPRIPDDLKDSVLASLEARSYESLQPRLWATRQLFRNAELSEMQVGSLTECMRDLAADLAYEAMPYEGPGAVGITTARAEFVRLVRDFLESGRPTPTEAFWVIEAHNDPLPEVRFAEEFME